MNNGIYIKKALELFKQNSEVKEIVRSRANSEIAKILGESLEDLEQQVLGEIFAKYATSKGTDTLRLALDMVATPEQKKQVLLQYHQGTADALGVDIKEYLMLNPNLKAETE